MAAKKVGLKGRRQGKKVGLKGRRQGKKVGLKGGKQGKKVGLNGRRQGRWESGVRGCGWLRKEKGETGGPQIGRTDCQKHSEQYAIIDSILL